MIIYYDMSASPSRKGEMSWWNTKHYTMINEEKSKDWSLIR